jgi:hypothetical protein
MLDPVADEDSGAKALTKNPLMGSGHVVAENVDRLRVKQNLTFAALAKRLEQIGRPIPTLGLRKIVAKTRRVDVDDLVGLAVALNVSPISLLIAPAETPAHAVPVTGYLPDGLVRGDVLWNWLTAQHTLPQSPEMVAALGPVTRMMFGAYAWPAWIQDEQRAAAADRLDRILLRGEDGDD